MCESHKHEFASMKEAMWQRAKRRAGLSMNTVWAEFYEAGREHSMPDMFTLVKAGLVIPLNTACVERGFSHHVVIKNKHRSRLKVVDFLLRVKLLCQDYKKFDDQRAMELHDSMHNSLISSLARKVDQLQFAAFDEELANEDLVDFTPLLESEPEEDSGFDFSETEDEEEAAAEDDELSQAAVHGQSATIDLDEDDGLGEALGFF